MTAPGDTVDRPSIVALRLGRPFPEALTKIGVLVVGGLAGLGIAYLIAAGQPEMALGIAVILPVLAVVVRDPFAGVLLWVLTVPYFMNLSAETGPVIWAVHRIGVPALILLVVVHTRLGWRRWGLRPGLVDICVAAFIGIGLINVVLFASSVERMIAAFYDKLIIPIALFWLIRALAPRRRELMALIGAGLVTIAVQSMIGMLTWVAPSVLPSGWLGRAGERTTGTVGGPGPFTITLVLFAVLAIHLAAQSPELRRRITLLGFGMLAGVAVLLSLSRGSWLGAGLAVAGLALIHRRMMGIGSVVGLVLVVGLAVGPLADQFVAAQERIGVVDTVESRMITNDAATRMIAAKPVTGFGFGNFEKFDEQFKQRVGDIPLKLGGSSHNTYLNMLAELGIPATILYLGVPFLLLAATFRKWRYLPRTGLMNRSLVLILWLAVLDQFVVQNFQEMIHASFWGTSLWWLTLGLIATILERAVKPRFASTPA